MMKKTLLTIIGMAFMLNAFSQVIIEPASKPVEVKWSGFLMNNIFYDSRKNVDALDGLLVLFPMPQDTVNARGNDLNDVSNLNFVSFAARLRSAISGPDALGASTSGLIEFDFTSRGTSSGAVRFRHAWVKLNWATTELLVGRAWHPMVSPEVAPSVNSLNWGAPFQPFNRSDQITLTQKLNQFTLSGSLLFQNDYALNGPKGKSFLYQTNSLIPNMHAQIRYKSAYLLTGVGVDFKRILPETHITSPTTGIIHSTNEGFNSLAFLGYAKYNKGKLSISSKSILANNISESMMAGAFGMSSIDPVTGDKSYTPYKHWFLWSNVMYGSDFKAGIFGGYFKNLGAGKNLVPGSPIYGLGENIASMYRITPMISYTSGKIMVAAENEYNVAYYGSIDHANKGRIINTVRTEGMRILVTMYYFF